jgi:hypothetical protein
MKEIALDSRGNTLYVGTNLAGGRTYYSDEIGGGVVVWDTCLVSKEMLKLAISAEEKYEKETHLP